MKLHRLATQARSLLLLSLAGTLCAAEKLDLSRITPVPATEPIPTLDFVRPQLMQYPQLNRAGTHVAALVSAEADLFQLLVSDLVTQKTEMVGDVKSGVYAFWWLGDSRLLLRRSHDLRAGNLGDLKNAYPMIRYSTTRFVSCPERNRNRPLVWLRYDIFDDNRDGGVIALNTDFRYNWERPTALTGLQLDLECNQMHILETYPLPKGGLGYGYLADKEGELAFAFTSNEGKLTMHRLVGRQWEACPADLESTDIFGAGNKPGEVLALPPAQPGMPRPLQFMDAATGKLGDVLIQDKNYDFEGSIYRDPATHEIVGATFSREVPRVVWFSEEYKALQKRIEGFFPRLITRIINSDLARQRFLVSTFSDRQPPIFYLVDLEKGTVGLIKNSAPWIEPSRMCAMSAMKFKTRDGLRFDAYVTLPKGASKQNPAPLVVLPHDGPWERDSWGFYAEVQFLADRGYAVLQPNYRGSPGFNWMYPLEDQWAFRKMCDDVTDATKTLVSSGYVDPNRIAIMGNGFGAYLALSGVAFEPSLYRCAVAIEGIFDWERLIKDQKYFKFDHPGYGRLVLKLGDPKMETGRFAEISPIKHIDKVKVPVFLSQFLNNSDIAIAQTKQLASELGHFQVPYELMMIGREGKDIDVLMNRVERYQRIEAFLAKHLAARK